MYMKRAFINVNISNYLNVSTKKITKINNSNMKSKKKREQH